MASQCWDLSYRELVYKDHPGDQQNLVLYTQVVFICRFNNMENIPLGTCKIWSLKEVVFIYRWSLEQV